MSLEARHTLIYNRCHGNPFTRRPRSWHVCHSLLRGRRGVCIGRGGGDDVRARTGYPCRYGCRVSGSILARSEDRGDEALDEPHRAKSAIALYGLEHQAHERCFALSSRTRQAVHDCDKTFFEQRRLHRPGYGLSEECSLRRCQDEEPPALVFIQFADAVHSSILRRTLGAESEPCMPHTNQVVCWAQLLPRKRSYKCYVRGVERSRVWRMRCAGLRRNAP